MHQLRGSQAEQRDPLSPAGAPPKPYPRIFFWCVVLVLGLLRAWATARGGLHQIVSAYWSPLYPLLPSLVFRYLHPAVQWKFMAAHPLNFGVYVASLAASELLLKELILLQETAGELPRNLCRFPRERCGSGGTSFFCGPITSGWAPSG